MAKPNFQISALPFFCLYVYCFKCVFFYYYFLGIFILFTQRSSRESREKEYEPDLANQVQNPSCPFRFSLLAAFMKKLVHFYNNKTFRSNQMSHLSLVKRARRPLPCFILFLLFLYFIKLTCFDLGSFHVRSYQGRILFFFGMI